MTNLQERMQNENFIIVDIEAIKTSEEHSCIRKLYILSKNGMKDLEVEFVPCKWLSELSWKYKQSFFLLSTSHSQAELLSTTTRLVEM